MWRAKGRCYTVKKRIEASALSFIYGDYSSLSLGFQPYDNTLCCTEISELSLTDWTLTAKLG
jgi:hypothetical protein